MAVVDKFDVRAWLLGALFTVAIAAGGAAFSSQAEAIQKMDEKVNKHAERIAKLEAIMEAQVRINEELKELHKERDRRDAR
jgi:ribulose kinase